MTDTVSPIDPPKLLEAILFAAIEPVSEKALAERLPDGTDVPAVLKELQDLYADRGVNLVKVDKSWAFRTNPDLIPQLVREREVNRKPSRAAIETLAIIAYHQPVSRPEIEEIRGVTISKGTVDLLFELGWIEPKGRRQTPGRPMTWGTTMAFLDHFGLSSIGDLPGVEELKQAGLLDTRPSVEAYSIRADENRELVDTDEDDDMPEPLDPDPEGSGGVGEEEREPAE